MAHKYHYDKERKLIHISWMDSVDFMDIYKTLLIFDYPRPEHGHRIILDFEAVKMSHLLSGDLMRLAKLVKQHIGEKLAGAKIALLTTNPEWQQRAKFYILCRRLLSKNAPEYGIFNDAEKALTWVHCES